MFRDSDARGNWILKLLRRGVVGSFIMMMSLFVVYETIHIGTTYLTEGFEAESSLEEEVAEVLSTKEDLEIKIIEDEIIEIDEMIGGQSVQSNELIEELGLREEKEYAQNGSIDQATEAYHSESIAGQEMSEEVGEVEIDRTEVEIEENVEEMVGEEEAAIQAIHFPETPEEMIANLKELIKIGEHDLIMMAQNYLNQLDLEERLALIALSMQKAEEMGIQEVLSLVQDGVSDEDIELLQDMAEEHFTQEEVDLFYEHYIQYASIAS